MDDVAAVLNLLDRYSSAQQTLEHQTGIQRDRMVWYLRALMDQAAAWYETLQADPERWERAQESGIAQALEDLTEQRSMLDIEIKQHGVTWRGEI